MVINFYHGILIFFLNQGSTLQGREASVSNKAKLKDHPYYGKLIGELKTNAHDVSGMVFAATDDTFYIVNFNYDGQGPGE